MSHNYKTLNYDELPLDARSWMVTALGTQAREVMYVFAAPGESLRSSWKEDGDTISVDNWYPVSTGHIGLLIEGPAGNSKTGPLLELLMADDLVKPVQTARPVKGTLYTEKKSHTGFVASAFGPGLVYGLTEEGKELVAADGFQFITGE